MAEFNISDCYRLSGLQVSSDVIERRVKAFETLRKDATEEQITDLVRLYFGMPTSTEPEWFRAAFADGDSAFSMIDNEREVAILAGGLLEALNEDEIAVAGLAPLTAAMMGQRSPKVRPALLEIAARRLQEAARDARGHAALDYSVIRNPAKSKVIDEKSMADATDVPRVVALVKRVNDESSEWTKTLANQVASLVRPMTVQLNSLQEEVEILWWHIGGHSRQLNKPFSEIDLGAACLLAGLDMADLSRMETAPVAAPALLTRTLSPLKKAKGAKVTLSAAVDSLPSEFLEKFAHAEVERQHADLLPVLTALQRARENGHGSWQPGFKKLIGIDASASCVPIDLAIQVMRERLLARALAQE